MSLPCRDSRPSRRRWAIVFVLTAAGCGPPSRESPRDARVEVQQALERYDQFVRAMAHDSIAQSYVATGEMSDAEDPPFTGPAAIEAHLRTFADFQVLGNRFTVDSVTVVGDAATQWGTYWQRVRVPAGDTVEVRGRFAATWQRVAGQPWRVRRMHTDRLAGAP